MEDEKQLSRSSRLVKHILSHEKLDKRFKAQDTGIKDIWMCWAVEDFKDASYSFWRCCKHEGRCYGGFLQAPPSMYDRPSGFDVEEWGGPMLWLALGICLWARIRPWSLGKESHTGELIKKSGEFAVNIPDERLLKAPWLCGTRSGRRINKFKRANLTSIPS